MANPSPQSSRLRAALSWWRSASVEKRLPTEADFVTQDPQRYAALLSDAFIVDASPLGGLVVRFVGTELSDYVGWGMPGQRLDLGAQRKETALIRHALAHVAATGSPHLVRGRLISTVDAGSGDFEALCLPLATSSGGASYFGVLARAAHWRLPPAPPSYRVEVDDAVDLNLDTGDGGDGDQTSAMAAAPTPYPRGA